jgi:hypothetical protein
MDLNTLAGVLRQQARRNASVVFDQSILAPAQVAALQAGFGLGAEPFAIAGIAEGDIPDPAGGQLVLAKGTVAVLGQQGLVPRVVFANDAQGALQFTIDLALPPGWKFADSFATLTLFPFAQATPNDSHAIYASASADAWAPWPGQPAERIALEPGLNLASWLVLDIFSGALVLLEQIVNGTDKYKFFGPVRLLDGAPYPVISLASPLAAGSFKITDGLEVGGLALGMEVSAPQGRLQGFSMRLSASTADLQFGVEILSDNLMLGFYAEPLPGHTFGINQILALPGGKPFRQYIPSSLSRAFDAAALQSFVLTKGADNGIGTLGFVIGSNPGYTWKLIDKVLVLENLRLQMDAFLPGSDAAFTAVSMAASAKIFPAIFTGDFDFLLELDSGGGSWQVSTISGTYRGQVRLADLVQGIVGHTTRLPDALAEIAFSDFGAVAARQDDGYTYTVYGQARLAMALMDTTLVASLNAVATYAPSGYGVVLKGSFLVGQENFELELDLGNSGAKPDAASAIVMRASWKALGEGGELEFADIASAFGFSASEVPAIPKDLDLALKQADLYYDFTRKELLIGLQSATYGSAVFTAVADPVSTKWQFFFGLNVDKPIPISNLPLIGNILPAEDTVQIRQIRVVIASAAFGDALATQVNTAIAALGAGYPAIPDNDKKGMEAGLGFSMKVSVGSYDIPIMFGAGQQRTAGTEPVPRALVLAAPRADAPVSTATSSDGVLWFNLQKTFGPVSIQKIGVQYKNERIFVLVNMQLSGAGLTIGVTGLGIGSKISDFDPAFTISGIDVTYAADGVEISGGLLGSLDPLNFVGELMIKAEAFGIAGLAGYTSVDGHPSLFLYAVLNAPLGGPPYFFVEGLAGGFGFNRDLQVPDVSGIADFPLVQWARGDSNPPGMNMGGEIGSQVNQVLARLADGGVVTPRAGEYWLAAGIKFTSFKLINSFALAMVKFGTELEVDLVGVTSLAVPPVAPVVFAEMQLLASFKPAQGLIGIAGQLTPRSYLLSPDCHLSGGFAYYFWFAGPNEGNFVMTMGGYNPRYSVPDYYPRVPRIGINWQVAGNLVIKGEEYFAVTSAAVMAGGGLSASWSGGGVTAWFNVQADFLMVYQPFHYYLDASVDIGASFRINLLFTHVTLSIHVGADLEIWGPDFTGEATVDLDIISFTISFGASGQKIDTTVPWADFVAKMLPGHGSDSKALRGGDQGDTGGVKLDVSAGLVRQLGAGAALDFVVSPETVELTISTAIPIKESHATFSGVVRLAAAVDQPQDPHGNPIVPNEAFGVGPAGLSNDSFTPSLEVSITLTNDPGSHLQPTLECVRVFSNAPNALWQKLHFDSHGTPILGDVVNDATLANVVTGYRVVPVRVAPHHSLPINIEYLKYTVDPNIGHFAWSGAYIAPDDDFASQTVEDTILSQVAVANRAALLPALNACLAGIATSVSVQGMADATHAALMSEPVLRLLGEQRVQSESERTAHAGEQAGAFL